MQDILNSHLEPFNLILFLFFSHSRFPSYPSWIRPPLKRERNDRLYIYAYMQLYMHVYIYPPFLILSPYHLRFSKHVSYAYF